MTKAISSYPKSMREAVVMRRLRNDKVRGLGYWAAKDALAKLAKKEKEDGTK